MALQFNEFRKKLSRKKYLELDFLLEDGTSLSIIDDNKKNLDILKKVFNRTLRYDGLVLLNDKDIKKIKKYYPYFKNNIGFYGNFSLYQNFKHFLKLYKIKKSKKEMLEILIEINLNPKELYSKLNISSKEKFHIVFSSLISEELFIIDMIETNLSIEDSVFITRFLQKEIAKKERNIVIISEKLNDISNLCEKTLVISDNKQVYFDDNKKLEVIKDLIILELTEFSEENLYRDLQFDLTIIDSKLIIRKENLEDALYYFVKSNVEVLSINDFNQNTDLYEVKE